MDSDNQTEDIKEEKSHLLPGLSEVAVVEEEPLGDETVGAEAPSYTPPGHDIL